MSDERETGEYRDPGRQRTWRILGWVTLVILVLAIAWWLIEFTGDNAERDLDDPSLEPLQPAAVIAPRLS